MGNPAFDVKPVLISAADQFVMAMARHADRLAVPRTEQEFGFAARNISRISNPDRFPPSLWGRI